MKCVNAVTGTMRIRDEVHPCLRALDGKLFRILDTVGDGACAIHSVFGVPTADQGQRLFVRAARKKAAATMGTSAAAFRARIRRSNLYDSIASALWRDMLYPVLLQQCGIKAAGVHIRTQGEILWHWVAQDRAFKEALVRHVRQLHASRSRSDCLRAEVFRRFQQLCQPD